jgi:hypothetical protein
VISIPDAFKKFRSRLELTEKEEKDASRRHNEIRDYLKTRFDIERDFLTGSYKRWTKTKPLKDVDIFCVLGKKERHRRNKPPGELLAAFEDALVEKYGRDNVSRQRRSITVDFGVKPNDEEDTDGKVMSFDVVPAFAKGEHYEIQTPERARGGRRPTLSSTSTRPSRPRKSTTGSGRASSAWPRNGTPTRASPSSRHF